MRVSHSKIKLFKACRRAYELKYVEGLEPVSVAESLQTGSNYHEKLDALYKTGDFENTYDKESAMAEAYRKYIYPQFKVNETEKWLEWKVNDDIIVGIIDGITEDGRIVEHKTTGASSIDEYFYDLDTDEQILMYMMLTNSREVWYTVVRKPTIRQKKAESDEEFYQRMVEWYDEDTYNKIRVELITRTDDEVDDFREGLEKMLYEMKHTDNFYRNNCHCKQWGRRCDYASVCMHYDPNQEYVEFTKSEDRG